MSEIKEIDHARQQARLQLQSIVQMVNELKAAIESGNGDKINEARDRIGEDPLSIEVRDGWRDPGSVPTAAPVEFKILLCTGGPAVRIVGDVDENGEPSNPRLQFQDWFTSYVHYPTNEEETEALWEYCQQFYYA